ncbi:putative peroxisomal biogenesis factor 11 [Helianthus anomalus]
MSTLDVARTELALRVLYLNKAEARGKICRAIQYGSNFVSNGKLGTAQNVDKSTSLATKVFRLFKFVNDLHALISPTAPGTPLPLVLLGKNKERAEIIGRVSLF